jgi:hypothetical protein
VLISASQHDVQERELALIRTYEARLLARESESAAAALAQASATSHTIGRLSDALRRALRAAGGEDGEAAVALARLDVSGADERVGDAVAAWALEREAELARLEKENEELRRLAGLPLPGAADGAEGMPAGTGQSWAPTQR